PNFNLTFDDLRPGDYTLSIEGLAGNCSVTGLASRDFHIAKLDDRVETFAVNCPIPDDPTKPLVYEATWSVPSAPTGQIVYQDLGMDLTTIPPGDTVAEDLKSIQGAFTYDASVVRMDSVVKQGTWNIQHNELPGKELWNAFVNGPGIKGRFTIIRFYYTV